MKKGRKGRKGRKPEYTEGEKRQSQPRETAEETIGGKTVQEIAIETEKRKIPINALLL